MENIVNKNSYKQMTVQPILDWIAQNQIMEYIRENVDSFDRNIFPSFQYHNLTHSLNVCLLAMVIARSYDIDYNQKKILLDASLLHDIGRIDDTYDFQHGAIGATLAESILSNQSFYQDEKNLLLAKALILGHNRSPYDISTFLSHGLEPIQGNVLLLKILKDADILDLVRLKDFSIDLNEISLDVSKSLLDFAEYINNTNLTNQVMELGEVNELSKYTK